MNSKALIFPQTVLRSSQVRSLAACFDTLVVIAPASQTAPTYPVGWLEAGLIQNLSPDGEQGGAEGRRLAGFLRDWDQWLACRRGSGELEALKAGIRPEEGLATASELRKQIKEFGESGGPQKEAAPRVSAGLYLHLAHLADQEEAEVESLLEQAKLGDKKLADTIGLGRDEDETAEFEAGALKGMVPLDYNPAEEGRLAQRLSAWATFCRDILPEEGMLVSPRPDALNRLMEAANARLTGGGNINSLFGLTGEIDPDSPAAQVAASIRLPALDQVADQDLSVLLAGPEMMAARGSLSELCLSLANEAWGREARGRAREAANRVSSEMASASGLAPGTGSLLLAVFPGLARRELLALMNGQDRDLPDPAGWPDTWPRGNCLVAALARD